MKKTEAKPIEAPKPFTLAEYTVISPCTCPACGGKMLPAEYYIAVKGDVRSKQDWSQSGKVTTTTTTHYHNVRQKTGGFCPKCYTKSRKSVRNSNTILTGVVGTIAIACIVLFILFQISPSFKETAPGAGAIGLFGGLIALYFTAKHFINGSGIRSHLKQINSSIDTSLRSDHISEAFVVSVQIPLEPGEVILGRESVRNMRLYGL